MSQGYICYEQKDNIEGFENFGADINTSNYTGKLGAQGTDWSGEDIERIGDKPTEESCAEACYNNPNCSRFVWNGASKVCILKNLNSQWILLGNNSTYAGYIIRKVTTPVVTTTPALTTRAAGTPTGTPTGTPAGTPAGTTKPAGTPAGTTKPANGEEKTIIPGVPDLYFYIGLGVVGFIILLIIIMMMLGGSKKRRDDDY